MSETEININVQPLLDVLMRIVARLTDIHHDLQDIKRVLEKSE